MSHYIFKSPPINHRLFNYAERGDLVRVRQELSNGADVNWKNPDWIGQTALHAASVNGHSAVVKELLRRVDINPNVMDEFGWTPLHSASFYSRLEVIKELLQVSQIDANVKTKEGWTPLHSASYSGNAGVVNELLQLSQIDTNVRTKEGWTFLDVAQRMDNVEIIQLPLATEFLLEELNALYNQLEVSDGQLETDVAESESKQAKMSKRLKELGAQIAELKSVVEPALQEKIVAVVEAEKEILDLKTKIAQRREKVNAVKIQNQQLRKDLLALKGIVVRDSKNFEAQRVKIQAVSSLGVELSDLTATFQSMYCVDDVSKHYGNEFDFLCGNSGEDWETVQANQMIFSAGGSSTFFLALIVVLAVYTISSWVKYYRAKTANRLDQEFWVTKWIKMCSVSLWVWKLMTQDEESATRCVSSDTVDTSIMEMKNYFAEELKKVQAMSESSMKAYNSEIAQQLKKLNSETERLKAEMTRRKKEISTLAGRVSNTDAKSVKSIKRARSVGQGRYHRQDPAIYNHTGVQFKQLKNTV